MDTSIAAAAVKAEAHTERDVYKRQVIDSINGKLVLLQKELQAFRKFNFIFGNQNTHVDGHPPKFDSYKFK